MRKLEKRELYLIGIFIIILIYFIYDYELFKRPGSSTRKITDTNPVVVNSNNIMNYKKYTQVTMYSSINWLGEWQNDPFFYASKEETQKDGGILDEIIGLNKKSDIDNFSLEAISWRGNSGYAIINNSILKEGDTIGGHVIEKIAEKYIILKQGTKTIRLTINE